MADMNSFKMAAKPGTIDLFVGQALDFIDQLQDTDSETFFGNPTDTRGDVLVEGSLLPAPRSEVAAMALSSVLARTYLAGRYDQIFDTYDTNDPRFVRARHLRATVELAAVTLEVEADSDVPHDEIISDGVALLESERGSLHPVAIQVHSPEPGFSEHLAETVDRVGMTVSIFSRRQLAAGTPNSFDFGGPDARPVDLILEGELVDRPTRVFDREQAWKEVCDLMGGEPIGQSRKQKVQDYLEALRRGVPLEIEGEA